MQNRSGMWPHSGGGGDGGSGVYNQPNHHHPFLPPLFLLSIPCPWFVCYFCLPLLAFSVCVCMRACSREVRLLETDVDISN